MALLYIMKRYHTIFAICIVLFIRSRLSTIFWKTVRN